MIDFLKSPIENWHIEESDIILSLWNGGSFTSLMTGSQALYQNSQPCVILGFSSEADAEKNIKNIENKKLEEFKAYIYCSDASK
jgi:hypothetical protein